MTGQITFLQTLGSSFAQPPGALQLRGRDAIALDRVSIIERIIVAPRCGDCDNRAKVAVRSQIAVLAECSDGDHTLAIGRKTYDASCFSLPATA